MKYTINAVCNCLNYFLMTQLVRSSELLEWIYTIVFAISVLFSIIWPIVNAVKDKKITKDEYDEIQKSMKESEDKLKEMIDNERKEDK